MEKCELCVTNVEEKMKEMRRLFAEGWAVYDECYYDRFGNVKIYRLKGIRPKEENSG